MNPHALRRLVALPGMIAIWLIVLMPVISQLVVPARIGEPVAAVCTVTAPSAGAHQKHQAHRAHDNGTIACSYCDLLATHAALPAVASPLPVLVMFVTIAAPPVLSIRFTPLGAFPSGRPRAPPAFSRS
ncbi:DUF2946 domain-containing protein [Paraburkholderia lycopersici]|uniref:DUF2946 domain-containing protein n=1 Tax=Paraburkholderia lycopersici TaxID=416944 RepID=UPI000B85DB1C|nr:DUF2946 domain-containing protein [Paraburkholderia lycopersici]